MTEPVSSEPIDILLVEDDEGDALMTREAFEHYKIRNRLHVVKDGEQALDYLHRRGEYRDAVRPGLILLDLNLQRRDGREVLAELKADPELRVIPVVVLTTSFLFVSSAQNGLTSMIGQQHAMTGQISAVWNTFL